jgi:excisionase family DNA binding protein
VSAEKEILNIDEAARFLGVSVKTFNKVLHSANIPARKIGREWKFSRQALVDWVGNGNSADYYRESDRDDGVEERTDVVHPMEPTGRRTSGWRLELD